MNEARSKLKSLLEDGKTIIDSGLFPLIAGELDNKTISYYAFDLSESKTLIELQIDNNQVMPYLHNVCKFIQRNDRNSDIMTFFQEVIDGDSGLDSLLECVYRILNEYKKDAEDTLIHGETIMLRKGALYDLKTYDKLLVSIEEDFKNE